jgi:ABC-type Fe3+-hydroxamate transport system substrate-binding protein
MFKILTFIIPFSLFVLNFALIASNFKALPSPQRIVSMSLASDEILIELTAKCGGLERIAALSTFADHEESSNIREAAKSIKGRVHSELETILNFKPDLVIGASFNRQEVLHALRQKNINVLTLSQFSSADDIAQNIITIGHSIHCPDEAKALKIKFLSNLNKVIKKYSADKPTPRLINYSPDMTVMAGNTLFDDLVKRAGAVNAATERGLKYWPKIDAEILLTLRPDAVIVTDKDTPRKRKELMNHPVWKKLTAIQKGHLIFLDPRQALSTSHFFSAAVKDLRQKLESMAKL